MARTVSRADDRIVTTRGIPRELPEGSLKNCLSPLGKGLSKYLSRSGTHGFGPQIRRPVRNGPASVENSWLGGHGRQRPHLRRVTRLGPGCCRNTRIRAGDTAGQLLLAAQRVGDFAEQLGELDIEGRADRRQQLRRRLLLPALIL